MAKQALALKYRPHTFDDVVEQDNIKATLKHQLETNTIKNCYLFTGGAGTGKAQPLYSKVLTPSGFIKMGDVEVNTEVIGRDGNIHKVTSIYDRGVRDIYEVTFSDGTNVRCCDEHLWTVQKNASNPSAGFKVIMLKDILNKPLYREWVSKDDGNTYKSWLYFLPKVEPAQFSKKHIFIPPYVMGLLIADGSLTYSTGISIYEDDVKNKVANLIEPFGYELHLKSQTHPEVKDYEIVQTNRVCNSENKFSKEIKNYGLNVRSEHKHIPYDYLYGSIEDRIELIRGIFDGDAYIDKRQSGISYTTVSEQLAKDIAFLVRSLGGYASISGPNSSHYLNEDKERIKALDHYDLYIKLPKTIIPISSNKHLAKYKTGNTTPKKSIRKIEYIGKEPCKCIMVDSEEHLYITDGYTVTHNTTNARIFANEINEGKGNIIEMDAASNNSVDDTRRIIEDAKHKSMTSKYKVYLLDEVHMISNAGWNSLLKIIEEPPASTIFIFCTTDPQKIPNTILSRVQRYDFRKISFEGIVNRLKYIIECENKEGANITYTDDALEYISKLADGGMRDSITTLDKCISYNSDLTLENVTSALGTVNYDTMFDLTDYVFNYDTNNVIKTIETIHMSGANLKQFIKDYSYFVLDLCKYGLTKTFNYVQIPSTYKNRLDKYNSEAYMFFNQLLGETIKLNTNIKWEGAPKPTIESTFILLCQKG
jgi:DNA polymerase-3 subunit gamma/tau